MAQLESHLFAIDGNSFIALTTMAGKLGKDRAHLKTEGLPGRRDRGPVSMIPAALLCEISLRAPVSEPDLSGRCPMPLVWQNRCPFPSSPMGLPRRPSGSC